MSTRFPQELGPALDTRPLVADAGKGATAVDKPPPASPTEPAPPRERAATWEIADIAFLKNQSKTDPVLLRASSYMLAVKEGLKLHDQLLKIARKNVKITVEAFESRQEFFERRNLLMGVETKIDPAEPVNGHTDPIRARDGFLFDIDEKTGKPRGFNVLLVIPDARSSGDVIKSEEQCVEVSPPFRRLKMSATLFHELLHVHQMSTKVDYGTQTIQVSRRDGAKAEDFNPDTANTGHGDDTSFPINTSTLKLETEGQVDPEFRARIASFVDQVVQKFDLKAEIAKECAAFKASAKPER